MSVSRRDFMAATGLALAADFLWGTAISAHQSEGNNTNSDSWIRENVTPTLFKERSGDACDSYHRRRARS